MRNKDVLIQHTETAIQQITETLDLIAGEIQWHKDNKTDKYKTNSDYAHLVHAKEWLTESKSRAEIALRNLTTE